MLQNKVLKKLAVIVLSASIGSVCAEDIYIPQISTAGIRGLTIQKERQLGEYFMRQARGSFNLAADPVMDEYLNAVGRKLVANADSVYFPFEFFMVKDPSLNASAFLGGKVQVNAGLFHYAATEDQFASVLAHEISHVTQRHLARFIEDRADKSTLTMAALIGSIAMSIINPAVGMAAMTTSLGGSIQSGINFTRENESEADRVGLNLLYRAGFNPLGMSELFRKLLEKQGNIPKEYAMLIDHPLSEERVADAYNRAKQLPSVKDSVNPDFMLAKARADVRYMGFDLNDLKTRLLANHSSKAAVFRNYALSLIFLEQKQYDEALKYLNLLNLPQSIFVIDVMTDIDLGKRNYAAAISRLNKALQSRPDDPVIVINLANAYIEAGQSAKAVKLLLPFSAANPGDVNANALLKQAYSNTRNRCQVLQVTADGYAMRANYNLAMQYFNEAINTCTGNDREIAKAKAVKLNEQRSFDEELSKGF